MKNRHLHIVLLIGVSLISFSLKQGFNLEASIQRGNEIYNAQCATCHMVKGEGIPTIYPPLAKSDFLMNETEKSISMILNGGSESITVNGIEYSGVMPNNNLTDEQASDVINFIRNTWGNQGKGITPEQIKEVREKKL